MLIISLTLFAIFSTLMYLEGFIISLLAINFLAQSNKFVKALVLFFWPVTMPILFVKIYNRYKGLLDNPMLSAMTGLSFELPSEGNSSNLPFEIPSFPQDVTNETDSSESDQDKETLK